MNRHEFQQAAKKFRAGRLTLDEFADLVLAADRGGPTDQPPAHTDPTALAPRPAEAHKGDFGRILAVGGSSGMSGAIRLTGVAALRSGSGLVVVATPDSEKSAVESFSPCYMTLGLSSSKGRLGKACFDELLDKCEWADVVAVGPGMGRSKTLQRIMKLLYEQLPQPVVIDADGLNNLADANVKLSEHEGLRVLTPHPGEFQRLDGLDDTTDRSKLEARAQDLAHSARVTIVLKGNRTLITDGTQHHHNETGNPGMATAGSGDVLTGVIASLIGQGLSPFEAAKLGVKVHGLAGDLGAHELGQISLVSSDLLEFLPRAFGSLQAAD